MALLKLRTSLHSGVPRFTAITLLVAQLIWLLQEEIASLWRLTWCGWGRGRTCCCMALWCCPLRGRGERDGCKGWPWSKRMFDMGL